MGYSIARLSTLWERYNRDYRVGSGTVCEGLYKMELHKNITGKEKLFRIFVGGIHK